MTTMRAAVLTGPERLELQEVEAPAPSAGRVLVRVRNCGICGSDLHFYRGHFPAGGGLRMGHEIAGEIATVGEGVTGLSIGQAVAIEPVESCRACALCLTGRYQLCPERRLLGAGAPGGFAGSIDVAAYAAHPLPDGVDFEAGALTEPLAVVVHGLRQVGLSFGERVAVLGSGTIGLMAVVAARALGASDVFATARYSHQAEAARALGASVVVEADESATQALGEAFAGRPPEVVIETVGGEADTLNQAVQIVAPGGRVSVLGLFTGPTRLNATIAVLKEALLVGGMTYGRPGTRSDFEVALEILAGRVEEVRRVITHRVGLEEIAGGFATAADKGQRSIKVTVVV